MSLFSVFLIGIGLSMDACAVSFAKGICLKKQVKTYALKLGLAFGFFQAMMPVSYTHLDVYKRQIPSRSTHLSFQKSAPEHIPAFSSSVI